jgi:hypothetical protein
MYFDPKFSGSVLRVAHSFEPGEAPVQGQLRPGEPAYNAADGVLYVGANSGSYSTVASIEGANKIVVIEEAAYNALVAATATISTTLYIVTPEPDPE